MKDQHVIITGGAGGLGVAVVEEALSRGARVTVPHLADQNLDRLREHTGDREALTTVVADLTEEDEVSRVFAEPHDVLIHLMGGFTMQPLHEMELDAFRRHIDLQLTGTFLCCKHALKHMHGTGYGRIVTVGSKAVEVPMAEMGAYAAGKAAVIALTRVIAEEAKALDDVTANAVLPSVIDTPANRAAMGKDDAHKWVSPANLAETICFLASPEARNLRGAVVPVYGKV